MQPKIGRIALTVLLGAVAVFDLAEAILVLAGICAPPGSSDCSARRRTATGPAARAARLATRSATSTSRYTCASDAASRSFYRWWLCLSHPQPG